MNEVNNTICKVFLKVNVMVICNKIKKTLFHRVAIAGNFINNY